MALKVLLLRNKLDMKKKSLQELRGLKINPAQAVDLAPLLGVQLL